MWKEIINWEKYYKINENGEVVNILNGKIKKPCKNSSGYLRVTLENKNHVPSKERFFIHRLVAIHFISNPNNFKEVNHIDSDVTNNNYTNLEWCDRIYNERYSHINGKKEYKPFLVKYNDGTKVKYDVKSQLSELINVSSVLVKHWLHNKSKTYLKYGIKEIYYI